MRRRDFLAAAAALAVPSVLRAQEMRRIAIFATLEPTSAMKKGISQRYGPFLEELEQLGWVEGQNLVVDRYSTENDISRASSLASAVVDSKPHVIYAGGGLLESLTSLTDTVPIVSILTSPSIARYAQSLALPGGNVTGPANASGPGLQAKRLEVLVAGFPDIARVGVLARASSWAENENMELVRRAATELAVTLIPMLHANSVDEQQFRDLFLTARGQSVDGFFIIGTRQVQQYRELVIQLANEARLPAMYAQTNFVEAGGLLSYDNERNSDRHRRAASYVDKILRGADPAELPIEQPTTFDLVINLRTARALGIEIPPKLLIQATELID